jgi:outer membrane protein
VRKKEQELLKPIIEKAKKAISDVAKESGYAYVLDSSPGSPLLVKPEGDNIMNLVKKKLGITGEATAPPAGGGMKK